MIVPQKFSVGIENDSKVSHAARDLETTKKINKLQLLSC
jgi:hypothetical protein